MSYERSTDGRWPPAGPIGQLHLGHWSEARHRLLARLVPRHRAGPLHRRAPTLPGAGPPPIALAVGIDVPGAIVRVDRELAEAWKVDRRRIWQAATANLDRLEPPPGAVVADGPIRLRLVVGGPWTTGLVLRPDRLLATGVVAGGRSWLGHGAGHDTDPGSGPILAVAPRAEVLVLADRTRSSPDPGPVTDLVGPLLALASALLDTEGGPGLPLVPVLVGADGSFPGARILE